MFGDVILYIVEEWRRYQSEEEKALRLELKKDRREIDFDDLLKRFAGKRDEVYYAAEEELRHMPGGQENWRQALEEWFATHNPDDDGLWWQVRRLNELMGSPLKLSGLPEWERPEGLWRYPD